MKPNTIKDITDFIFLGKDFEELSHYDLLIINADWAEEQLAKDMKLMLDKNIIDNNTTFIICEGHGNTEKRSASILIDYLKKEGLTNKIIISDKYIAPDCDWYQNCTIGEGVFDILYSIDGDGTFLYTESSKTLEVLEHLFANNHNKNTTE